MQKLMVFTIFILFAHTASALARINEIMYNPEGADNNREFIEIYSDEFLNLSGYVIADRNSNDTLRALRYSDSSYALIAEEGFDFSEIYASVYSAGASIGNNLDNEGDEISLYAPSGELIDSVSYNGNLSNGNGMSLEFFNGEWFESSEKEGSPGERNIAEFETGPKPGEIAAKEANAENSLIYESGKIKARNFAIYLFMFLSAFLNIVLIWKR